VRAPFKVCRECGEPKSASCDVFCLRLGKVTRLCRECGKILSTQYHREHKEELARKQHEHYRQNSAAILARQKQRRDANLEHDRELARIRWSRNLEKNHAQQAVYREQHRDECAERSRAWRLANPERFAARVNEWHRRHPEVHKASANRRRALISKAPGSHSADDISAQYARQKGKCYWRNVNPECAVSLNDGYHVDHVVPLSKGGSNGPENLVLACPTCNMQKQATHPMDFAGILF